MNEKHTLPTIDIIIPIYNSERFLDECLSSIACQTYEKFNVIMIDDGSTDSSYQIANKYQNMDRRFTIIRTENRGASAARKTGIQYSTGSYVTFVDSDDYLEAKYLEKMVQVRDSNGADIVQCSFRILDKSIYIDEKLADSEMKIGIVQSLERVLNDWRYSLLWNKLISRHLLDGIDFKGGKIIDDEFYVYKIIMKSNSVVLIPDILYNYRIHDQSLMHNHSEESYIDKYVDRLYFMHERYSNVVDIFPNLKVLYSNKLIDYMIYTMKDSLKNPILLKETKTHLKKYARRDLKIIPLVDLKITYKFILIYIVMLLRILTERMF